MIYRTIASCSYEYLDEWIREDGINELAIINIETLESGKYCIWYRG